VIRATAGTWVSYATTLLLQILFAARFGSSLEAGGFIVVFSISVSVASIFVTTATVLVLPRLVEPNGMLSARAIKTLAAAAIGVLAVATILAFTSIFVGHAVGEALGLSPSSAQTVLAMSALVVGLFGLSGVVGTIALARGRRFIPSAAAAFPSVMGALFLATAESASVVGLFVALVVGGVFQLAAVSYAAWVPRPGSVPGASFDPGKQAVLTALALIALSLVPPIQRLAAGAVDVAGTARFDYAARSLQAAQQLLIGGLLVALLPDWSRIADDPARFKARVSTTVTSVALLLSTAGVVALVAAPQLVALVFERGAFTQADTASVASLIRLMSLGFVAEGITLVLVQAAFARQRAGLAIRVGFMRVGVQLALTLAFGLVAGAEGVAVAYSISMVVVAAVMVIALRDQIGSIGLRSALGRGR
jgi:putative peptidoglycan lipid II flippase